MIKKILLISIGDHRRSGSSGIDQIAYYIRKKMHLDIEVKVKYINFQKSDLENEILPKGYDVYGFYVDRVNLITVVNLAEQAKKDRKIVVFGGLYPSIMYKDIFEYTPFVDYIICGDGEEPFEFLLNALITESYDKIDKYDFIATKTQSKITKKMFRSNFVEMNTINDYYKNKNNVYGLEFTMMIKTNGCSHNCTYCFSHKMKKGYFFRSTENIVNLIREKIEKNNVTHIFFTDNDIFGGNYELEGYKKVNEICDMLQTSAIKKISYNCYARVDSSCFKPECESILPKMMRTGITHIFLGVESGNEADLKLYGKGATIEESINAIQLLKKYDILPTVGFIMINPYSDLTRLYSNYKFLRTIESISLENYARGQLIVEKYNPIYYKVLKDNLLRDDYCFSNPTAYQYKYEGIEAISSFLHTHFVEDELIGAGFDPVHYLFTNHYALMAQYPELGKYKELISVIKKSFIEATSDFFKPLYQDGNIQICENRFSEYKNVLLSIQEDCNRVRRKAFKDFSKLSS